MKRKRRPRQAVFAICRHFQRLGFLSARCFSEIQVGTVDVSYVDPLSQKVSSKDARSIGHCFESELKGTYR